MVAATCCGSGVQRLIQRYEGCRFDSCSQRCFCAASSVVRCTQSCVFGMRTRLTGDLAAGEVIPVTCCDWLKANKQTKVHSPSDWELKGQSDNALNWFSPFHFAPSHHVKCLDFHLFCLADFPPHHSFPSPSLFLFLLLISFSHLSVTVRLLSSAGSCSAEWTPHHLSLSIQAVSQTHHQSSVKWLISSPQQRSSHWENRSNLAQSALETSQSSAERGRVADKRRRFESEW